MQNLKPEFKVGYDGETEYRWNGQLWRLRRVQAQTQKNPDNRLIGCVRGTSGKNMRTFPPQELMQYFPGYVGAAYMPTGEKYDFKYTGGTIRMDRCKWEFQSEPQQVTGDFGLEAKAWSEEKKKV